MLRRKRVGPKTQLLYGKLVSEFHGQFSITDATPAQEIDSCLDMRLDEFYLQGELPGPGRLLYYAVAWHHGLEHALLPRSRAARVRHARSRRPKPTDPEARESVLLMPAALLHKLPPDISPIEAAQAATGFLLAVDVYGRAGDIARAQRDELRPPVRHQPGIPAVWTLTLFPSSGETESKTRTQDDTAAIGATHPSRKWLTRLCAPLRAINPSDPRLLGLDPARYHELFRRARVLAGLMPSSPHRLRHGGASADALLTNELSVSDLTIASRGRWASLSSVRRYRQPAQYLRQLQRLSALQLSEAAALQHTLPALLAERRAPRKMKK